MLPGPPDALFSQDDVFLHLFATILPEFFSKLYLLLPFPKQQWPELHWKEAELTRYILSIN